MRFASILSLGCTCTRIALWRERAKCEAGVEKSRQEEEEEEDDDDLYWYTIL